VSAILSIVADFAHNFTDGVALAAAFSVSRTLGIQVTLAVLFHELPHELGDVAMLVRAGYSLTSALKTQLITALGALAGALLTLSVDYISATELPVSSIVLPMTAGGFVYVATVDVVPQLFEGTTKAQSIRETVAIVLGVFTMFLVALFE